MYKDFRENIIYFLNLIKVVYRIMIFNEVFFNCVMYYFEIYIFYSLLNKI